MNYNIPIASLKKFSQDLIISKLVTGDVVKIKSEFLPLISHYGIVCRENEEFVVYHNDPDKFNFLGGNIIRENFVEWIKGKEIISVTSSNLNSTEIENYVGKIKSKKYDVLKFNCEHFISKIKDRNGISPQLYAWSFIAISILLSVYIIKKK